MALYILVSLLSCMAGVLFTVAGCVAVGYYASKRNPVKEQIVEVDPELLAEVLAEKLQQQALNERASKVSAA